MKEIINDFRSFMRKLPIPLVLVVACFAFSAISTLIGGIWVLIGEALDWLASQWS